MKIRDWQPILGLPLWVWLFIFPTILAIYCIVKGRSAERLLKPVWGFMDRVYVASGVIASIFMTLILALIVAQMIARWTGVTFHGSTEYAGYAMAATSFFALSYALMRGSHIRVSVFLNLTRFSRMWLDATAILISAIIATYFARYAVKANFTSVLLNERTQGQDYVPEWVLSFFRMFANSPSSWGQIWAQTGNEWVHTPIWLPQLPMSVGSVLLAIALWDALTRLLVYRKPSIVAEAIE